MARHCSRRHALPKTPPGASGDHTMPSRFRQSSPFVLVPKTNPDTFDDPRSSQDQSHSTHDPQVSLLDSERYSPNVAPRHRLPDTLWDRVNLAPASNDALSHLHITPEFFTILLYDRELMTFEQFALVTKQAPGPDRRATPRHVRIAHLEILSTVSNTSDTATHQCALSKTTFRTPTTRTPSRSKEIRFAYGPVRYFPHNSLLPSPLDAPTSSAPI